MRLMRAKKKSPGFIRLVSALLAAGWLLTVGLAGQEKDSAKSNGPGTARVREGTPFVRQPSPKILKGGSVIPVLSFNNQNIKDVIALFKRKTGLNILASDRVKGNFTAHLNNVRSRDALRNILAVNNLYYIEEPDTNLIRIVTRKEFMSWAAVNLVQTETFQIYMGDVKTIARALQPVVTRGISSVVMDERTNRIRVSDLPDKMREVRQLITDFTRPPGQLIIETKIVEIELNEETQFGIDWLALDIPKIVKGLTTSFIPRSASDSRQAQEPGLSIVKTETTGNGATVEAFLHALGKTLKVDTIAAPKVTAEHNKKAMIHVGRQIPYNETVTQGLTSTQSSSFKFLDTGTKLSITPQLTGGKEIYLDIDIEVSSSPEFIEFGENGSVGKAPLKDSTNIRTTVVVENNDLVILGGLIRKEITEDRKGIPLLKDIPLIRYLFSYNDYIEKNKETVIFIYPRVVKEDLPRPDKRQKKLMYDAGTPDTSR